MYGMQLIRVIIQLSSVRNYTKVAVLEWCFEGWNPQSLQAS